jgi:hypothetical protein
MRDIKDLQAEIDRCSRAMAETQGAPKKRFAVRVREFTLLVGILENDKQRSAATISRAGAGLKYGRRSIFRQSRSIFRQNGCRVALENATKPTIPEHDPILSNRNALQAARDTSSGPLEIIFEQRCSGKSPSIRSIEDRFRTSRFQTKLKPPCCG